MAENDGPGTDPKAATGAHGRLTGTRDSGRMARGHRAAVIILMLLAVGLRVTFVGRLPSLPFYWDEETYDAQGKSYAEVWQSVTDPAAFRTKLHAAFMDSLEKGESYGALVGAIYALAGPRPRAVFVVQAVLDAATCFLIYGIARQLGGQGVGLIALALAAVYPPFIFSAGRLQSETLCVFFYVGGLWVLVHRSRCWRWLAPAGSGALLALAMLARPALQFLFPFWLATVGLAARTASWRSWCGRSVAFALGFFLLIGPRLAVTASLTGHPLWSGTTDPSINSYAGVVFDNLGWRTDHNSFGSRGELPAVLRESGHAVPTMRDYRLATVRTWTRHPLETAAVLLHKAYVVWRHPYNDSRRTFLMSLGSQRRLQQLLLVLAAIGMPLTLLNWRVGVPLLLTAFYLWSTYLAVQIEVRYMVTAMPLMLCCAALVVALCGRGCMACWRARHRRSLWALAVVLVVSASALQRAQIAWLVGPPFSLSAVRAYDLHRGLAVLIMVAAAAIFFRVLRTVVSRGLALASVTFAALGGVLIFLVGGSLATIWHQWQCPLTVGDGAVRQEFIFPASLPPPVRAEIRLDLTGRGSRNDLVVTINDREARRFVGGPGRDDAVPPERFYEAIFAGQGRAPRPWHAWYAVPIDPRLVVGGQRLRLEARVQGDSQPAEAVQVFGDYPAHGAAVYEGPSPIAPGTFADISLYKYLGDGDFRMRRQYELSGESRSSYFDGRQWTSTDLSPLPGRQYGRYRIVLLLACGDGRILVF